MIAGGHGNENPNTNWMDSRGNLFINTINKTIYLNIKNTFRILLFLRFVCDRFPFDSSIHLQDSSCMDIDFTDS